MCHEEARDDLGDIVDLAVALQVHPECFHEGLGLCLETQTEGHFLHGLAVEMPGGGQAVVESSSLAVLHVKEAMQQAAHQPAAGELTGCHP